jgi:hypothetical protein
MCSRTELLVVRANCVAVLALTYVSRTDHFDYWKKGIDNWNCQSLLPKASHSTVSRFWSQPVSSTEADWRSAQHPHHQSHHMCRLTKWVLYWRNTLHILTSSPWLIFNSKISLLALYTINLECKFTFYIRKERLSRCFRWVVGWFWILSRGRKRLSCLQYRKSPTRT